MNSMTSDLWYTGSVLAKDPEEQTQVRLNDRPGSENKDLTDYDPDRWFWWRRPAVFSLHLRWFCVLQHCHSNQSAGSPHSAWAVAEAYWTPPGLWDLQQLRLIGGNVLQSGLELNTHTYPDSWDGPTDPEASITAALDRTSMIPALTEAGLLLLASRWPNSCWITRCECCDWREDHI